MPFYHFEVRTHNQIVIGEDAELADSGAARIEAAKQIGRLLRDRAGQIWIDENWQMDVTDQNGLILYVLNVGAMRSPATTVSRL